ncbi:ribonuclease-3 [Metamycoplasma subdolum]|uniref:Ribonuclease 3 n=1 Tax=Metamycoplasma subdolum TaxID=92407 RepID=A0A3M0A158_9BACT|nr:ribonuclease III [Metamycoplasma subdolum]RMA78520.1 ribonuclease-3 [Metamycoplasma subdolum]WPB50452.1 ribonuclease III [Metamycoplasma subdolum]
MTSKNSEWLSNVRDWIKKYINLNFTEEQFLLIQQALTHSSYCHGKKNCKDYQMLEFLGDAILDFYVSDFIYSQFNLNEGEATEVRKSLVSNKHLSQCGEELQILDIIATGKNAFINGLNSHVLSSHIEAIIGAIYLAFDDRQIGFHTKRFIKKFIIQDIKKIRPDSLTNYKSIFQEHMQSNFKNSTIKYIAEELVDKPSEERFFVKVMVNTEVYGEGFGRTKKEAEQNAAKSALSKIASD